MACILLLIVPSLIAFAPFLEFIFSFEYVYIVNHSGLYENSIEMIVRDKCSLSQAIKKGPFPPGKQSFHSILFSYSSLYFSSSSTYFFP